MAAGMARYLWGVAPAVRPDGEAGGRAGRLVAAGAEAPARVPRPRTARRRSVGLARHPCVSHTTPGGHVRARELPERRARRVGLDRTARRARRFANDWGARGADRTGIASAAPRGTLGRTVCGT